MLIARSIPLYYKFVRVGETADLFHSFAPVGNELICAFRRHRIVDFNEWGTRENFYESQTMLQRFDVATGSPISQPKEAMARGEDPRCISVRDRPFILSANPCGGDFNYVLFDIHAKKCLNIVVTNSLGFKYGKNWQPFVAGEKLYAVHGFSPFRILQIDVETGRAEIVFEKNVGLDAVSPHDGFTQFRGGCSAIVLDDRIVGFGHLTMDSGRHGLFQWTFSPANGQVSLSFDLEIKPLTDCGFKIIDPTCFFPFRDKFYLGLSCSNRDWFYGQTFVSLLLELQPMQNALGVDGSLASDLAKPLAAQEVRSPDRPMVHFFRAAELQVGNGTRSRNFEVIARAGKDEPGHVVYGPYINLNAGTYQARLQYSGAAPKTQEIGEIEACSTADCHVLAKKPLFGTDGKLFIATLDFQVQEDAQGAQFQTRIGSQGTVDMRLADVAISRV
jgi:hypothetical protein